MARGGARKGGAGMFDFSENAVNIVLMVVFIILLIVFLYYVYLWFNKQSVAPAAGKKVDGGPSVRFSEPAAATAKSSSGYESDEDKKSVKKTTESFMGRKK